MKITSSKALDETFGRFIAFLHEKTTSLYGHEDGEYFVSSNPPYVTQFVDDKYWSLRACGIAGVQMVLKAQLGDSFRKSTMELVNEGLSLGGYNINTDVGWYHNSLVKLAGRYGVRSRTAKFVSPSQIAKLVMEGNYVLASFYSNSGGHLVLIHGVTIKDGKLDSFTIHDPYSLDERGKSKKIKKNYFNKKSKRRIIIFEDKHK